MEKNRTYRRVFDRKLSFDMKRLPEFLFTISPALRHRHEWIATEKSEVIDIVRGLLNGPAVHS